MWMGLRTHLGLPASRFLRMAVLECVGIVLALVLYLTFRYVFPFRKVTPAAPDSPAARSRASEELGLPAEVPYARAVLPIPRISPCGVSGVQ